MKRFTAILIAVYFFINVVSLVWPKASFATCSLTVSSEHLNVGDTITIQVVNPVPGTTYTVVATPTNGGSGALATQTGPNTFTYKFVTDSAYQIQANNGADFCTTGENILVDDPVVGAVAVPVTNSPPTTTAIVPKKYEPTICTFKNVSMEGVDSAIGCIPTKDYKVFLEFILSYAFGAAGGIIVLMLIKAGYDIITSAGDPNKIAEIKQSIISVISGLILIVFSMVLLRTIGVDILGLPGFI